MGLYSWFKDIFAVQADKDKVEASLQPQAVKPEPKAKPPVPPQSQKPKLTAKDNKKEEEKTTSEDPKRSKANGEVTTFLWKPDADYTGNNPVVLVGCDNIKSTDLHMEILGKRNRPLKVTIKNTGRANGLGHLKYGRIHFRPQRSVAQFERSAPLKIRFYHTFTGKKVYVKVRGKARIVVKQVSKRKDLK